VVLGEPLLDGEPPRQRLHDVDLEADHVAVVVRVLVDVGLAALDVAAPDDLAARADRGERAAVAGAAAARTAATRTATDDDRERERDRDAQGPGEVHRARTIAAVA